MSVNSDQWVRSTLTTLLDIVKDPELAIIDSPDEVKAYNVDWLKKVKGDSKLVLKPSSTEEVSQILKYCNHKNLAVVPQGGNTGMSES